MLLTMESLRFTGKLARAIHKMGNADELLDALAILRADTELDTIDAQVVRPGTTFAEYDDPKQREWVLTEPPTPCRTEPNNVHLEVTRAGQRTRQSWCIAREQKMVRR
jgi:hypothetical protein